MADKKISQLSAATTPLAGTEVLPIVQGGSTVKVSIDNVTKGRTVNATSFDTDVAAAGVTLAGTTLSADGTDANIDVNVTPKGTGSVNMAKVNIDGGTVDGTVIGGSSAAAGTFTTLNASGDVSLNGGSFVFNDSAADKDFRIEGVSDAQIFFTDASANAVGFGTTDPSSLGQVAIVKSNSSTPLFVVRDNGTPSGFYVSYVSTNALGTLFGVQSDGNVRAGVGNFLVATAGKGIDFSANSHAAGMTSELLDDYEEGTFTPVLNSVSYTGTASGNYVKIGQVVHVFGVIVTTVFDNTDTSAFAIGDLPFASDAYGRCTGTVNIYPGDSSLFTSTIESAAGFSIDNSTNLYLNNGVSAITYNNVCNASGRFYFAATYCTAT